MTKISGSERETLRQAAEAAKSLLTKLEQERVELEERATSLRAVIEAWENVAGKRQRKMPPSPPQDQPAAISRGRVSRGKVAAHVDLVLQSGDAYREPEIRDLIKQRFQVVYGRSTVYATLRRGLDAGKYEQAANNKWRAKTKPQNTKLPPPSFGQEDNSRVENGDVEAVNR